MCLFLIFTGSCCVRTSFCLKYCETVSINHVPLLNTFPTYYGSYELALHRNSSYQSLFLGLTTNLAMVFIGNCCIHGSILWMVFQIKSNDNVSECAFWYPILHICNKMYKFQLKHVSNISFDPSSSSHRRQSEFKTDRIANFFENMEVHFQNFWRTFTLHNS